MRRLALRCSSFGHRHQAASGFVEDDAVALFVHGVGRFDYLLQVNHQRPENPKGGFLFLANLGGSEIQHWLRYSIRQLQFRCSAWLLFVDAPLEKIRIREDMPMTPSVLKDLWTN